MRIDERRRRVVAAIVTATTATTAGCGLGGSGTETVPETLPLVFENRATKAAVERSRLPNSMADEGIPMRITITRVNQEEITETELFSRSFTVPPGENRTWDDVLTPEDGTQYALKAAVAPEEEYHSDFVRFETSELAEVVGPELTVRLGLFPDDESPQELLVRAEPDG